LRRAGDRAQVLKHVGWTGEALLLGNMAIGTFKLLGEVRR
jgi:hypothetical protein